MGISSAPNLYHPLYGALRILFSVCVPGFSRAHSTLLLKHLTFFSSTPLHLVPSHLGRMRRDGFILLLLLSHAWCQYGLGLTLRVSGCSTTGVPTPLRSWFSCLPFFFPRFFLVWTVSTLASRYRYRYDGSVCRRFYSPVLLELFHLPLSLLCGWVPRDHHLWGSDCAGTFPWTVSLRHLARIGSLRLCFSTPSKSGCWS